MVHGSMTCLNANFSSTPGCIPCISFKKTVRPIRHDGRSRVSDLLLPCPVSDLSLPCQTCCSRVRPIAPVTDLLLPWQTCCSRDRPVGRTAADQHTCYLDECNAYYTFIYPQDIKSRTNMTPLFHKNTLLGKYFRTQW